MGFSFLGFFVHFWGVVSPGATGIPHCQRDLSLALVFFHIRALNETKPSFDNKSQICQRPTIRHARSWNQEQQKCRTLTSSRPWILVPMMGVLLTIGQVRTSKAHSVMALPLVASSKESGWVVAVGNNRPLLVFGKNERITWVKFLCQVDMSRVEVALEAG